jgi:hypothetical protein
MLPFSLERGLLLEDRNVLLAWGASWEHLAQLDPSEDTNGIILWSSVECLGGFRCHVIGRPNVARPVRDLEIQAYIEEESPEETFKRVGVHLREIFGVPSAQSSDPYFCEEWRIPPITVYHSIFERFGGYHVMRIRHRGPIE